MVGLVAAKKIFLKKVNFGYFLVDNAVFRAIINIENKPKFSF